MALHRCTSRLSPRSLHKGCKAVGKEYFKSALVPGTSLNELDKVEGYLNKGKQLSEWLGIRVYEPEHQQNGEIAWHPRNNPSDKLKNIMTIGIHEGHAFLIKDIEKLAKMYVCGNCRGDLQRFATSKDT